MRRKALLITAVLAGTLMPALPAKAETIDMGSCRITYYCDCYECSEGYGRNTASGKHATAGRTCAADLSLFNIGDVIDIDGEEFIVEDVGGGVKGEHIDIFVDSHAETLEKGVKYKRVKICR